MRDSKLYEVISQLTGHELNRLHRFVISPYFNRNEPIIQLFEWIKQDLKRTEVGEFGKEDLWKITFGAKDAFDDGRFRKLQSDLLKLVEEFFAQEAFATNPIYKTNYLLNAIFDRELDILKSGAIKTAMALSADQIMKPASFYYYQYEIEQSIYYLNRTETERSAKSNIEEIAKNLDRFYLAEKLRYYCTILNHQHLASLNYKMLFINEIIEHVKNNDYNDTPPIVMYYQILLSYTDQENRLHFDKIKELIRDHIAIFSDIEKVEILDSALNYCIKKMNSGKSEFLKEAFDLYREWLSSGLLHNRGHLDPFHYKNIVTIGLRLNEFDWIEQFINTKSELLIEKHRTNAVTFNLAQLYFYKKEYSKVIKLLSQVEYDDITYNLNSKTLLMASYYELDEIEALNSLLDTFRVYLSRNNKIPAARRKHYLNTISIVRKLAKIRPGDHKEIDKLEKEIETTQGVVSKNWIMEKLEALK